MEKIIQVTFLQINIWDGHIAIDAKSIVSVFSISEGKPIDVEMVSVDEAEIERFTNRILHYVEKEQN